MISEVASQAGVVMDAAAEPLEASGAEAPDGADGDPANLRLDYQVTVDVVKLFSDIRFRCLVFVTALATVAAALLPGTGDPGARAALGVVGFLATLGITVYELRNSQLYEAAVHRAKWLETRLGMARTTARGGQRGLFNERPLYVNEKHARGLTLAELSAGVRAGRIRLMRFGSVPVKHDQGLACIYGAVLGGWAYLASHAILSLPSPGGGLAPWPADRIRLAAALIGLAVLLLSGWRFVRHDRSRYRLR